MHGVKLMVRGSGKLGLIFSQTLNLILHPPLTWVVDFSSGLGLVSRVGEKG